MPARVALSNFPRQRSSRNWHEVLILRNKDGSKSTYDTLLHTYAFRATSSISWCLSSDNRVSDGATIIESRSSPDGLQKRRSPPNPDASFPLCKGPSTSGQDFGPSAAVICSFWHILNTVERPQASIERHDDTSRDINEAAVLLYDNIYTLLFVKRSHP